MDVWKNVSIVLIALCIGEGLLIYGFLTNTGKSQCEQKIIEKTVYPKIELIEIRPKNCPFCIDFNNFTNVFRAVANAEIKSLNYEEAKELVKKYNIRTLPTLIIKAPYKPNIPNFNEYFEKRKDAWIFLNKKPVYFDIDENRFVGLVKITVIVDRNCKECRNPLTTTQLSRILSRIKVADVDFIDVNEKKAKELIEKYYIDFVPAVIFSKEIKDYNKALYSHLGNFSSDGSLIVREKMPPYKDLEDGSIKGLLNAVIITNIRCWGCKNAKELLFGLEKLGLVFSGVEVHDFNSEFGRLLISNYKIRYLPAAIITGETKEYRIFKEDWNSIGRKVNGSFVVEGHALIGSGYYYDANLEKIVFLS